MFYLPTLTVFLINSCFSTSSVNAKQKFCGVPHLLPHLLLMCVIFKYYIKCVIISNVSFTVNRLILREHLIPFLVWKWSRIFHSIKFKKGAYCPVFWQSFRFKKDEAVSWQCSSLLYWYYFHFCVIYRRDV